MLRHNRKNLVTSKEKVLLHLLSFQKYYQDADAPVTVTQDGIAEAIDVGRNNVSKIVNELGDGDMVDVQTRHVKGFPTKRKVYFLTSNGIQQALSIKEQVENTAVTIVDFDGMEHEDTFSKINKYLPRRYTLSELLGGIYRGRFDCSSFHESKVKEERRFIDFTDRKPTIRSFFGREGEIQDLETLVSEPGTKVVVVHGIPGIGKTTLLAKFTQEIRYDANVFWFRIHEWTSSKVLLGPLAEFLSQMGKKGLERYLSQSESPVVAEVCPIIENEMADVSAILILDDVQKADDGVRSLLQGIVNILEELDEVNLLCTSRTIPEFYSRNLVLSGLVREMQLQGLDEESSIKLLESRDIPKEHLEDIARSTNGHPLFLELVDRPGGVIGKDMRMFLEQEVFSKLELNEKRILEIASVFRFPVFVDSFFDMEEEINFGAGGRMEEMGYSDYLLDYDTIDSLLSKSLLMESMGRMISMHDLIRDFVYTRLHPRQKKLYHKAAAKYYLQDSTVSSSIEALYHSLKASECKNAVRIAASNGANIISKGLATQFGPLLDEVVNRCVDIGRSEMMEILLLQGEICEIRGEWDKGIQSLMEILKIASPLEDRRLTVEANRRIGSINLRRVNLDVAKEFLEKGLHLATELGDPSILIDVHYDLGGLALQKGTFKEAIEHFVRAKDLSSMIGDDVGKGKAIYGIGRTYELLQDYEKAIDAKREALEFLEKAGDTHISAKVYTGMGNDLRFLGNYDEGLHILDKAIDLSTKAGDITTLGYALSNKAAILIEVGNYDEGGGLLENASNIFQKLDDGIMLSVMHLYRGQIYSEKHDWEWAKEEFEQSLNILRRTGAPNVLAQCLHYVGKMFVENNDPIKGEILFQESYDIAIRIGAEKLAIDIKQSIGELKEEC